ncbi:unnamed protein product, partial [Didymodactylos carnosus]
LLRWYEVKKVHEGAKSDLSCAFSCDLSKAILRGCLSCNFTVPVHNVQWIAIRMEAIKTLTNDKRLIIAKVDKGNSIVVLNREDYIQKGMVILDDRWSFKLLNENPTDEREKKFIKFLLKLKKKNAIDKNEYKRMRPDAGSRTPEAYFLVKVHKKNQPLRPIISSYDAYNYKTAKYIADLLSPAMKEGHSFINDSFNFVNKIHANKDKSGLMFSLDVSSLFTTVPLEKSIDIAIKKVSFNLENK